MNYFSAMIRNPADVSNDMGTAALKGGEQRLEYREKLVLWGESVVRHRRHRARKAQQTRLGDILQWNPYRSCSAASQQSLRCTRPVTLVVAARNKVPWESISQPTQLGDRN